MLCSHNDIKYAPSPPLDGAALAASTLGIMSRKELPIRFKAYPHANDNGEVSGGPPDPRLLSLARLIARAAVRDLIDGQTANDNSDNLSSVAELHPVTGTEQVSTTSLLAAPDEDISTIPLTAEPLSAAGPEQDELPLEAHPKDFVAKSTRAPSLADLPAGRQLDLFPNAPNSENTHDS